jgi:peptide subunit release factor RF-3
VITSRLRTEYNVAAEIEPASYSVARWVADASRAIPLLTGKITLVADRNEHGALLFGSEWELQYFERQNPTFPLLAESPT